MENILTIVCFFPLLGVALIVVWPKGKEHDQSIKWIANLVALIGFFISLPLITEFNNVQYIDSETGMRFVFKADWIPTIGESIEVGIG